MINFQDLNEFTSYYIKGEHENIKKEVLKWKKAFNDNHKFTNSQIIELSRHLEIKIGKLLITELEKLPNDYRCVMFIAIKKINWFNIADLYLNNILDVISQIELN